MSLFAHLHLRQVQVSVAWSRYGLAYSTNGSLRVTYEGISMKKTLDWQIASIRDIKPETAKVKSFTLTLPSWMRHRAGQHYDIRLTAEDGYQTQRSYSIASEPERESEIDIAVERNNDGEVSTYLHDVLVIGDNMEVRGPIGGYFVWEGGGLPEPLLLIAGG